MKKNLLFIFVLFAFSQMTFGSECDSARKAQSIRKHTNSKHPSAVSGPHTTDPKTPNKTGYRDYNIHNQQDNFKRSDSLPYHPAPAGKDTLRDHSNLYYDFPSEDGNMSKSSRTNPSVVFGYGAEACPNNEPPDNAMAVSNGGFIVSAVNCGIFFYNSSGTLLNNINYPTFFNTTDSKFSDPRLIYDVYSDRFIFFIQYGGNSSESKIYVAFSSSNDPTQVWHYYSFDIGISTGLAPNLWFDYPSIGINETDFCVTGNLFTDAGSFSSNLVLLINKQDGYNNASLTAIYWTGVTDATSNIGFTITPATAAQNISYSNVLYMVSTLSSGGSYIVKYTITGSASAGATIAATDVNTLQSYTPSATATQPSGTDLANYKAGCRVQSVIYLNGTVSFVFSADYNSGGTDYNSIYFNHLDVGSNTLNQSWSFLAGSNYNYPSVASFGNSATDLADMLCFLKSDGSTNPEVRFKYFDAAMNQLGSAQVRAGDASVNYTWATEQRWGDYTATQRRYNAGQPETWVSGSYGNTSNIWQTYIAQITGYPGNVGISEVNINSNEWLVYPNPVKDELYVKGDFKGMYGFPDLYTIDGKLLRIDVTRKGNEMFQVDVSRLPSGVYLLKLRNSQAVRFIKE